MVSVYLIKMILDKKYINFQQSIYFIKIIIDVVNKSIKIENYIQKLNENTTER